VADFEHLESIVRVQQRRRLLLTGLVLALSTLCAIALIAYATWTAQSQFRLAEEAVSRAVEAKRNVTELEQRITELTKIRTELEKEVIARNTELQKVPNDPAAAKLADQRIVRLVFRGAIERETMRGLQSVLQDNGFVAPGSERIGGNYNSGVSYSRTEDREAATRVASIVRNYFMQKCPPAPEFAVSPTSAMETAQIEVHIYLTCKVK
jgi:hypothetical protein